MKCYVEASKAARGSPCYHRVRKRRKKLTATERKLKGNSLGKEVSEKFSSVNLISAAKHFLLGANYKI